MATATNLVFVSSPKDADSLVLIGRREALRSSHLNAWVPDDLAATLPAMIAALKPGDAGKATTTWRSAETGPKRVIVGALPDCASRYNTPGRSDAVHRLASGHTPGSGSVLIVAVVDEAGHGPAAAAAIARAFPQFSLKGAGNPKPKAARVVYVAVITPDGASVGDLAAYAAVASGIRLAQRLVDSPTSVLGTLALVAEAEAVAAKVGATCETVSGEALRDSGFGGLWGVGKAANEPPALVTLTHEPEGATEDLATWVIVGKGIVYDTGGLSIKTKTGMPGMKRDMGGAAGVLGAFEALATLNVNLRVHAILCVAENAVGPDAVRPDDIITLRSGRTIEINNTDAEGRLVLSDGIAFAAEMLAPDVIVDMATLTGAQLVATGRRHAAIVCNNEAMEAQAVRAGRHSGDLVHPLPYVPEFYRNEFRSAVADAKNSAKDRMNAGCGAAAQFIAENLGSWKGPWLHIDMAGPGEIGERATGFGVALLVALIQDATLGS